MKLLYTMDFSSMWPVPIGLVILAENEEQALQLAREQVTHTEVQVIIEIQELDQPKVIFYESGEY